MISRKVMIRSTILAAAAAAVWALPAQAQFYSGKTIDVIVPAGAGGGLTRSARAFTNFMKNHIAGNPNMVIRNIPGGTKGHNFLAEKAKPDGLTIMWGPLQFASVMAGGPGVRYDPSKFEVIGAGNSSFVSIIRTDTKPGIKQVSDIAKASNVVTGGIRPGGLLDMLHQLSFDALGITYRHVTGFRGQPKMNAAIRSKEIQALTTGHPGYHAFYRETILKDGSALAIYYHSPFDPKTGEPIRLPGRYPTNIKHFVDAYKDIKGGAPSGAAWEAYKWLATYETWPYFMVAPAGTPKAAIDALRAAHAAVPKDAGFRADWTKQFRDVPIFRTGEAAAVVIDTHKNISPAALAFLKKTVAPGKK